MDSVIPLNRRFRREVAFMGDSQSAPWWQGFILQRGPPSPLLTGGRAPAARRPLSQEGWVAGGPAGLSPILAEAGRS